MAKWADFLISGVWFSQDENTRHVSHVVLHVDNDANVGNGKKVSKDQVISLIAQGDIVTTVRWNYGSRKWSAGAFVEIYHLNGKRYLRTVADASVSDNLDNMLPMGSLTD